VCEGERGRGIERQEKCAMDKRECAYMSMSRGGSIVEKKQIT